MIHKILRQILSGIDRPVVVEVGAHLGTDTEKIARYLGEESIYLAIEPDPRTFVELVRMSERIKRERMLDIFLFNAAIADASGLGQIYLSDGEIPGKERRRTDSSSIMKPLPELTQRLNCTFEERPCILFTLDTLCGGLDKVDLIWCDVQGAELKIIKGGEKTLGRTRYLYIEVQDGNYYGQPGRLMVLDALGAWWKIEHDDGANLLLRNTIF